MKLAPFIACWIGSAVLLTAADAPAPSASLIDLPAALQLAGAQNPEVKLAREKLNEAQANLVSAQWQFFPWITPGVSYRKHDNLTQDVEGNIISVHKDSFAFGPTIIFQLDLGDAIYNRLATRQLVHAATSGLESQRQETILTAAQGYFDLVRAQAAVGVSEEAARIAEEYSAQVSRAVELGVAFKGDALHVQVQADRNRQALRQAQEQRQIAAVRLAQTLHVDSAVQLVARDGDLVPMELIPRDATLGALLARALEYRPEIGQNRFQAEAARAARDAATYGPLYPTVGAQIFLGGLGGSNSAGRGPTGNSEDYQLTLGWRIGPGGLFDKGRVSAAESRLRAADLAGVTLTDLIIRQVSEGHARLQSLADQIATTRHAQETAAEALRLTQERKDFAVGIVLENIEAEQELTSTRLDYLNAVAEFNKAGYAVLRAIGGLKPVEKP